MLFAVLQVEIRNKELVRNKVARRDNQSKTVTGRETQGGRSPTGVSGPLTQKYWESYT